MRRKNARPSSGVARVNLNPFKADWEWARRTRPRAARLRLRPFLVYRMNISIHNKQSVEERLTVLQRSG